MRAWGSVAGPCGVFLAILCFLYAPLARIRPFEGDNLFILQWAARAGLRDVAGAGFGVNPEWRPLAYASVWLQYQWAQIDHIWSYYFVNVLLWVPCAWLVYRIVRVAGGPLSAGLLAAAVVLTSRKLMSSMVLIVDRQASLACLFGLAAWLIVAQAASRRASSAQQWLLGLCLVLSPLGKEHGLAFAAAAAAYAVMKRRRDLAVPAAAALVTYVALRAIVAPASWVVECETHAYFFREREVCFAPLGRDAIAQTLYNVAGTAVDSLTPGVLDASGYVALSPRQLVLSAGLLAMAVMGWRRGPSYVRLGLFVWVFNAMLNFSIYHSRNHVVVVCALGIAVGTGWAVVMRRLAGPARPPWVKTAAIVLMLAALTVRASVTRRLVAERVRQSSVSNPCALGVPSPDREFLRAVINRFDPSSPACPP